MDVVYWEGGLLRFEVQAIEEMRKAFTQGTTSVPLPVQSKSSPQGKSLAAQLQSLKIAPSSSTSMWPWKGYAGFRFADARGIEGEFDLVIITHKVILIVELKHWHGAITSNGGKWYQNGDERGRSPVAITQNKVFILKRKLEEIRHLLPNKRIPFINFCVVLTGNCKFDQLPGVELQHVLRLEEFLKLKDESQFDKKFHTHSDSVGLNRYFNVFDSWLQTGNVKPKELVVEGFRAGEMIFEHPGKVYVEYQAVNENNKAERALLRLWDFSKLDDIDAKTAEGRFKILSRERDVLVYLSSRDVELSRRCLRPIKNPSKDSITQEFSELCELPAGHYRFNEFINRFAQQIPEFERIKQAKILVAQFSTMHGFKVAHRDLGDHSVWLSPSSAIALSNFISAYHQPAGTVGPRRDQLSIGAIELPEDQASCALRSTPFHRDVFSLGILCWHLILAKPLPLKLDTKYMESVRQAMESSESWYAKVLAVALESKPESRYANANTLLDALNFSTPINSSAFDFDHSTLERFSLSKFNAYKIYPESREILDSESKEIYQSDNFIVKLWPSIHADSPSQGQGPILLEFFERLEALKTSNYDFLPLIENFGFGKNGTPFLIQRYIAGLQWDSLSDLPHIRTIEIIKKFIFSIKCLHEQQISHGDLHPANVVVMVPLCDEESAQLYLLDIPDMSPSGDQPFNNRYSPTYEDCTSFERDNFAVMRMSVELLGMDWDEPSSTDIPEIRTAIDQEISTESGFISLVRFSDALDKAFQPKTHQPTIDVELRGHEECAFTIYPDNGRLFISVKPDPKDKNKAEIYFNGIGGKFSTIYNPSSKSFEKSFKIEIREDIPHYIAQNSDFEVNIIINVSVKSYNNLHKLSEFMRDQPGFHDLVLSVLTTSQKPDNLLQASDPESCTDITKQDNNRTPENLGDVLLLRIKGLKASKIWKAIIETEEEALPMIEVADDPLISKDRQGLMIPFSAEREILESFDPDDKVKILRKKDNKFFDLGEIDIRKSTKSAIYLNFTRGKTTSIRPEERLYLQTSLNRSSLTRRKKAIERILGYQAVIPGLVDYFDEGCTIIPSHYGEQPTEESFSVYQRKLSDGRIVGLNEDQKAAFTRLVSSGPLGLLQGPPGTGKTEFIAAFCHYLISHIAVKNILLVSQSHEAVNTAAERIRAHCRRLDTNLDVVRISNREQVVSDELKDVFSRSIVTQQQQSFRAELKQRLSLLAPSLGVSTDFIKELIDVQSKIYGLVRSIERVYNDLTHSPNDKEMQAEAQDLRAALIQALKDDYGIKPEISRSPRDLLEEIYNIIAGLHGVRNHELKRCLSLIELSEEFMERIASERANYDEFLVRSRTLVCGTCVGIGLGHLKLADNRFDWVIIDEAARSSPSELAIAMQVGSRVLLVGDHRQLPPTYDEEHKKAIARQLGIHHGSEELKHAMRSDFERAFESEYGRLVSATLKTQYRMQPAIGNLVSEVFYNGQLETGERPIPAHFAHSPESIRSIVTWLDTGVLGKRAYHSEDQNSSSIFNHTEADVIIRLLKSIEEDMRFSSALVDEMSKTLEPAIGVICMYAEQKKLVRRKFAEKTWSDEFKRLIKIDTVDSYQGKENRIVIVSITRSDDRLSSGFLYSPNRINVAMSRAMDRLIIVGDTRMWAGRNAELPLGKVASYIRARQHEDGYSLKPVDTQQGVK